MVFSVSFIEFSQVRIILKWNIFIKLICGMSSDSSDSIAKLKTIAPMFVFNKYVSAAQ